MKAGEGARKLGGLLVAGAIAASGLAGAAAASASAPPTPWDGTNPFHCTIQDAGKGTTVPDPNADPYCVNFDKTGQNVTELGLVQFLSLEPARAAAAYPKCFYFQQDHWRGSIVQSDGSTVIYEFYGHYFFDKATGDGGVWVRDFSLAGHTFDPASLPGFPPAYGQYFGPGTGGMITHDQVPADPSCAAQARANPSSIYAASSAVPRCVPGRGRVSRTALGPVRLGDREDRIRAALGTPQSVKRGFLHYCVSPRGSLLVGQPTDRTGTLGSAGHARTVMLLTTSSGFRLSAGGMVVGARVRSLHGWRSVGRVSRITWLRRGSLLAGVRGGRVAYLGAYDRRTIRKLRALRGYLRRAR